METTSFLFGTLPILMGAAIVGGPAFYVPLMALSFIAYVPGTY
jgi:hypothetical protein